MSGIKVYEPLIRAPLGTASHFCEVVAHNSKGRGASAGGAGSSAGVFLRPLAAPPCKVDGFHIESLMIYRLRSRKFVTHNDLHWQY